jgi:hypothetical protein
LKAFFIGDSEKPRRTNPERRAAAGRSELAKAGIVDQDQND